MGLVYGHSGHQKSFSVNKSRILVGSSDRCDLVLESKTVSGIHAVVEADLGGLKLYDMNSMNGTYVNGQKVVYATLRPGDIIKMANIELKVAKDIILPIAPSKLDITEIPILPGKSEKWRNLVFETAHPLANLKTAEFSEYIFEQAESIHPIFNWIKDKESIEVLIIFRNIILSADYFPVNGEDCILIGNARGTSYIEFPYIGKNDKHTLVSGVKDNLTIHPLQGFKITKLSKGQHQTMRPGTSTSLVSGDLVCLTMNDIQIFIQLGEHPPRIRVPLVMRENRQLRNYLLVSLLSFLFLMLLTFTVHLPDEALQSEEALDRIASILYKGPLSSSQKNVSDSLSKNSHFTAGAPYKTVVIGGMEPDSIRQILLESVPQFRYCYQKVLDRSQHGYNGVVKLNFIIGPSGHVTSADAAAISGELPDEIRSCVVNVLRGIVYPPPRGGGTVEVDQPMNFYPKVRE